MLLKRVSSCKEINSVLENYTKVSGYETLEQLLLNTQTWKLFWWLLNYLTWNKCNKPSTGRDPQWPVFTIITSYSDSWQVWKDIALSAKQTMKQNCQNSVQSELQLLFLLKEAPVQFLFYWRRSLCCCHAATWWNLRPPTCFWCRYFIFKCTTKTITKSY